MSYMSCGGKKNGMVGIVWENGSLYNGLYDGGFVEGKEYFGLFNRWYEMEVKMQCRGILEGIMEGGNSEYGF